MVFRQLPKLMERISKLVRQRYERIPRGWVRQARTGDMDCATAVVGWPHVRLRIVIRAGVH